MAGADTVFKTIRGQENEVGYSSKIIPTVKAPCLGLCAHAPLDFMDAGMFTNSRSE